MFDLIRESHAYLALPVFLFLTAGLIVLFLLVRDVRELMRYTRATVEREHALFSRLRTVQGLFRSLQNAAEAGGYPPEVQKKIYEAIDAEFRNIEERSLLEGLTTSAQPRERRRDERRPATV